MDKITQGYFINDEKCKLEEVDELKYTNYAHNLDRIEENKKKEKVVVEKKKPYTTSRADKVI